MTGNNLLRQMIGLAIVAPFLVGCGVRQATPTPNRVATGVAEAKAIAGTLTTEALMVMSTPAPMPTPIPSPGTEGETGIQIRGRVLPTSSPGTTVDWYLLPGGDVSSFHPSYYVEVEIINKEGKKIDIPGLEACFYGKDGDILLIRAIQPGELQQGEKATFHLDTDGYTHWLFMSLEKDVPIALYFAKGRRQGYFVLHFHPTTIRTASEA